NARFDEPESAPSEVVLHEVVVFRRHDAARVAERDGGGVRIGSVHQQLNLRRYTATHILGKVDGYNDTQHGAVFIDGIRYLIQVFNLTFDGKVSAGDKPFDQPAAFGRG